VIDACLYHDWPALQALEPYLPDGWRTMLMRPHDSAGPINVSSQWTNPDPTGESRDVLTSVERFRAEVLADDARGRVVLGYHDALLAMSFSNYYMASTIASAANDWTIAEWLTTDPRVFGSVLVCASLPERAAEEIRRVGAHERMVAVSIGVNALGRPFGHPVYRPIFSAAAELGLPVLLQVGSEGTADLITPPTAGGMPATYAEFRALGMHGHMSHVASLIVQGVFEQHPGLRVILVGGGAAWLPGYLWSLDYWYKSSAQEVPYLKRLPSEYFMEHFSVGTFDLEVPPHPGELTELLEAMGGFERILINAGGPYRDNRGTDLVRAEFPESWHEPILWRNAASLFPWPAPLAGAGVRPISTTRE
jgi:uncharacterized protein